MTAPALRPLALAAALAATLMPHGADATELKFSGLALSEESARWEGFTYLARDTVESINSLSARGAEELQLKLDLPDRGQIERAAYLLTVGQIQARSTWATSVLAHEYAHFAGGQRFGLTEHYFRDDATGEHFGWQKAWTRTFLGGDPGGPAVSTGDPAAYDTLVDSEDAIEKSLAGLNWQMGYSEARVRNWVAGDRRTVFDAADTALNRLYTLSYTIGSHTNANGSPWGGDPGRFIAEMENKHGSENVSEKMILTAAMASALSPNIISMFGSLLTYVQDGKVEVDPFLKHLGHGHRITWDVPHYLNKDGMSVSPILYWLPSDSVLDSLNSDRMILGLGLETTVLGRSNQEVNLTIDGTWDRIGLSAGTSVGRDGVFLELEASYDVTDHAAIYLGVAGVGGETMRGSRNMPTDNSTAWVGLQVSF